MISLVKNELFKLIKNKKLMMLIIILSLLSFGLISLCFFQTSNYSLNKDINTLNQLKEKDSHLKNDSKDKLPIEKRINQLESMINNHNNLKNKNFNWKKSLQEQNKLLETKKLNENKTEKGISNTRIEMNNVLINNNIKPTSKYSSNSYDFLTTFIYIMSTFFMFFIISITISDIISNEYSNNNIQTILLLPIQKCKIIFSKAFAAIILLVSTFLLFDLIVFIISGIIYSFGNYKTPIFVNPKFENSIILNQSYNQYISALPDTSTYISVGNLLIKAIIFQVLFIICTVLFCTLISLLTKNNIISLIITVLTPVIALFINSFLAKTGVMKILSVFFVFLNNPIDIITNKYPILTGCTYINYNSSLFILIIWIILLLSLLKLFSGNLKYKK
ncbi:ABC transporter permease [Eubacterium multiforme]|uniref:ABC-2 family transporter protein n=1 Tax=Eubacterium multiforme TaxID=83339 RepID=A0ABT9UVP2_9FIRM|nr:ABC transporter permease [Eubacterium multiforme]MDQ0150397.1 hypothetical protein [Eubacterium multiforme]